MKLNPLLFIFSLLSFQPSQADLYEIDKNIKPHIYNLKNSQTDGVEVSSFEYDCRGDLCRNKIQLNWKDKNKNHIQELLKDGGLHTRVESITTDGDGIIITRGEYRFQNEGYKHFSRFRFNKKQQKFYKAETWETDDWSGYVAKVDNLLKIGAFNQAKKLINERGTSPNGGHTDSSKAFFIKFVDAIYREAKRAKKLGYKQVAGQLVNSLFIDMPFQYERGDAPDNTYIFMKPAKQGGFNFLDITKKNTCLVNELGVFLSEGGYHDGAIRLIEQIIKAMPERASAWQDLGNVYLKIGKKKKAIDAYKKYFELMNKSGNLKDIPNKILKIIKGK